MNERDCVHVRSPGNTCEGLEKRVREPPWPVVARQAHLLGLSTNDIARKAPTRVLQRRSERQERARQVRLENVRGLAWKVYW